MPNACLFNLFLFLSVIISVIIIISITQQNVKSEQNCESENMRAAAADVCCSPVGRLGGAQTPCKCQQEDETSGLWRSTNTRLRRRESSPSFLMCWFHGARDAGSQVSLVSLPRLDSRLEAAGPFVFFGIVCLYVKCLCVLISLRITCLACPKFQRQTVLFLPSLPSVSLLASCVSAVAPIGFVIRDHCRDRLLSFGLSERCF